MKKNILAFVLIIFCALFQLKAQAAIDFSSAIGTTSMPSDQQILSVISRFNLDEETKQKVFQETKQRLRQIYSTEDVTKANEDLNSSVQILNTGVADEYMKYPTDKAQILQGVSALGQVRKGSVQEYSDNYSQEDSYKTIKKYAQHDPISKRKKN
ncbi:hypothetical protein IJ670_06225 [bacterium]|nr:hypothetical protein [bacterium]